MEQVVDEMLQNIVKLSGIKEIMGIEHRVKSEQSLAGKLELTDDEFVRLRDSMNQGLRFLCRAELLNKSYSKEQILDFIMLTVKNPKSAEHQMEHLFKVYEECKGE